MVNFPRTSRLSLFLLLLSASFWSVPAWAQATFKAQLRGSVTDATGAVVRDAAVTLTNQATAVSSTVKTDTDGRYIFNNLAPASYDIQVEASGFKATRQTNVVLRVGQQSELDLKLDVGAVSASVVVTGDPVLLNSASPELGQEVTSRYVTEVPLFDRDLSKLAYLAPGVTESQGFQADQTKENFVSNGQRNSSAEIRLDGGLTSTPEAGEGAMFWAHFQPSIEIVQEFKVQTNSFSAEYGNNGGTVINVVSKSGGNNFHGSGYWFGRFSNTDAKNYFSGGQPVPSYSRNQYGGSLGGPLVKRKLFFFFNYDRTQFNSPGTLTTTVPTDLQRKGDFSQTFNPDGSLQQIFNPFDTFTDANGVHRNPFPGNVIPTGMLDPIAKQLM
ncbi:MAG TPA: carboxypeptidase-like regulatory domain-containing protein, partial [Terriglobales bacterium]